VKKTFGYGKYDKNGVMTLTTYDNEYRDMMMDISVYRLNPEEAGTYLANGEETAILLLGGEAVYEWQDGAAARQKKVARRDVFTDGPWCLHICTGQKVTVTAVRETELLVQRTRNEAVFTPRMYAPEDAPWQYSAIGKFGNVAKRQVNTIFDHDIAPYSNMVLGEVLNDRGNWSGYLPHRHPQPEAYFFRFDHPEGFGASFVGDEVYKSVNNSFSAIPGGALHPQAAAPGFRMYTCWMIRHLDNRPWLQTDRCEDERYTWLHEAVF